MVTRQGAYLTALLIGVLVLLVVSHHPPSATAASPRLQLVPERGRLTFQLLPPNVTVWDVQTTLDGRVWLGTSEGIWAVSPEGIPTRLEETATFEIRDLETVSRPDEPNSQQIWLATNQGLRRFIGGKCVLVSSRSGLPQDLWDLDQFSATTGSDPEIIVADRTSLYKFVPEKGADARGTLKKLQGPEPLPEQNPPGEEHWRVSKYRSPEVELIDRQLYVARIDGAWEWREKPDKYTNILDTAVYDIDDIQNKLWMATQRGLWIRNRNENKPATEALGLDKKPEMQKTVKLLGQPVFAVAERSIPGEGSPDDPVEVWAITRDHIVKLSKRQRSMEWNSSIFRYRVSGKQSQSIGAIMDLDHAGNQTIVCCEHGAFIADQEIELELLTNDGKEANTQWLTRVIPVAFRGTQFGIRAKSLNRGQILKISDEHTRGLLISEASAQGINPPVPLRGISIDARSPIGLTYLNKEYLVQDLLGNRVLLRGVNGIAVAEWWVDYWLQAVLLVPLLVTTLILLLSFRLRSCFQIANGRWLPRTPSSWLIWVLVSIPGFRQGWLREYRKSICNLFNLGESVGPPLTFARDTAHFLKASPHGSPVGLSTSLLLSCGSRAVTVSQLMGAALQAKPDHHGLLFPVYMALREDVNRCPDEATKIALRVHGGLTNEAIAAHLIAQGRFLYIIDLRESGSDVKKHLDQIEQFWNENHRFNGLVIIGPSALSLDECRRYVPRIVHLSEATPASQPAAGQES